VLFAGCAVVFANMGAVLTAVVSSQGRWPGVLDWARTHVFWSAGVVTLLAAVAAGAAVRFEATASGGLGPPPPIEPPGWVVGRPGEVGQVVAGLRRRRGGTVGITTGLHGAGGFGKTTLAAVVCADRRVRRRFRGRIYRVTVGRDVRGRAAVAAKVCEVIRSVFDDDRPFEDPGQAGAYLGRLMDGQRGMLLVIDDVWEAEQLEPFLNLGRRCMRLVTTRVPGVLPAGAARVRVDQMSDEQARRVLTWELPPMAEPVAAGLLAATGRWPLLLRQVNRLIVDAVATGQPVSDAGRDVLDLLDTAGPAGVSDLNGSAVGLDPNDPIQRARAVRATIDAGSDRLPGQGAERFAELGIFAEDEAVPVDLVLSLWAATAGLDPMRGRQLCRQMDALSLVTLDAGRGVVFLHDVVRDYLRVNLGPRRLQSLNGAFLDAVAATVPTAGQVTAGTPNPRVAWWDLDDTSPYLWDQLIWHLLEAGRVDQADAVAGDLRWVGARLQRFGPTAPYTDLSQVPTPRAATLRAGLSRASHLLTPTTPARCVADVLHSRLAQEPGWETQVAALRDTMPRPRLVNHWPLPDQPDPAARRTITGHTGGVRAVAVAPDGTWIATGGADRTVRVWDVASGQQRARLTGHLGGVRAVAVAPDGTWIATGGADRTVRVWDVSRQSCKAMMRVERGLAGCAWIAGTNLLTTAGDSGIYLFNLLRDVA
jgi:hypothetical protein